MALPGAQIQTRNGTEMLQLLQCCPIAQFALGPDHRITMWNKACELLTGFSAEEMLGTKRQWEPFYDSPRPVVADLIIDQNINEFFRLYHGKNAAPSKIVPGAWEATDFFTQMAGKDRYIYFLAAPILDADGNIIGAVETLQDITEQKKLEEHIRQESELLRRENITLKSAISERYRFGDIIGKSHAMQEVYELIAKAAASDTNVIVYGESGTGKELVASAIHRMSDRKDKNFIQVNCGAIPEQLMESEFFGYRKGAFTGATTDKEGFLCKADGGILFLDEVGELNTNMQVKLLRAIEGGGYTPLGSNETRYPDIRIIAATNRDLSKQVEEGKMREDFYYRIHVIPIHLPPLRERKEDLPLLIDHFLNSFSGAGKTPVLPGKVLEALLNHDWPGNIRELQNVMRRYIAIREIDFGTGRGLSNTRPSSRVPEVEEPAETDLRKSVEEHEKAVIIRALNRNRWHRSRTAREMGISRKTLFRKMKHYGLI